MLYLIHACKDRDHYIQNYLVPSLISQGIPNKEIKIWMDENHKGNLIQCMESFKWCGELGEGATWHIQDDVISSRDFYKRTRRQNQSTLVCGFCGKDLGPRPNRIGTVNPHEMWWSFPCIQIPNHLAGKCARWFYDEVLNSDREDYVNRVAGGKSDDWFFRRFMILHHPYFDTINLSPNLVDNIDYLLGGSTINKTRTKDTSAVYFEDKDLIEGLESKLKDENLYRTNCSSDIC